MFTWPTASTYFIPHSLHSMSDYHFLKLIGYILPAESGVAGSAVATKFEPSHPLHVHSFPKWNSLTMLGSVLCHPPLGYAYVWLTIYCSVSDGYALSYLLVGPVGHERNWRKQRITSPFPVGGDCLFVPGHPHANNLTETILSKILFSQ